MSIENSNPKYKRPDYEVKQLNTLLPLEVPKEVLDKIKLLCKNIPKVEWSGILFYTTEGSIKNPTTFKITLKDILPMHVGDMHSTEYQLDAKFIDFIEEDFDVRATWQVGHIHSHHCMRTFFSGVDNDELYGNSISHNYYLSFITNNYLDFQAKVAFTSTAKKDILAVPYVALDEQGKEYVIEKQDFIVDSKKVFVYDCEISSAKEDLVIEDSFVSKMQGIIKQAEERVKTVPKNLPPGNLFDTPKLQIPNTDLPAFKQDPFINNFDKEEDLDADDSLYGKGIVELAKKVFNIGNHTLGINDRLDDILDTLVESGQTGVEIAQHVVANYTDDYKAIFENLEESPIDFVTNTYTLLDYLEEFTPYYPEIKIATKLLGNLIEKFILSENENTGTNK